MPDKSSYTFANPSLSKARVQDVVAKIAKVTLKDTIRVMKALDVVCDFTEDSADVVLEGHFSPEKPTQSESDACVHAYDVLVGEMGEDAVEEVRSIR